MQRQRINAEFVMRNAELFFSEVNLSFCSKFILIDNLNISAGRLQSPEKSFGIKKLTVDINILRY